MIISNQSKVTMLRKQNCLKDSRKAKKPFKIIIKNCKIYYNFKNR